MEVNGKAACLQAKKHTSGGRGGRTGRTSSESKNTQMSYKLKRRIMG